MIALSIYSIVQIVDKYNPKYTKIPSNMVDTVETDNGNRFINYTVVNLLYKDGDKTAEKAGDTNGYSGKQWNAVYYTKSFEAGKCMTATGYFIDSAENFGKYTPVAGSVLLTVTTLTHSTITKIQRISSLLSVTQTTRNQLKLQFPQLSVVCLHTDRWL